MRKEKARFEKMEADSHSRLTNAEAAHTKAQGKTQKALVAKVKLADEAAKNPNPKNQAKYETAKQEVMGLEKLEQDAKVCTWTISHCCYFRTTLITMFLMTVIVTIH